MKIKSIHPNTAKTGPCVYEVWHAGRRRLEACGAPGHQYLTGKARSGPILCPEHAAFYMDAFALAHKEEE